MRYHEHPLMADMQVIVRHQDQGALRLDHLHDQALCGPKGEVIFDHPHNAAVSAPGDVADTVAAGERLSPALEGRQWM